MDILITNLATMSTALFGVAADTIEFVTGNPLCLVGMVLWVFVAGAGIVRSFVKGV